MKKFSVFVCVLLVFGLISNLRAAEDGTYVITGDGTLTGENISTFDATYTYSGAGTLSGVYMDFAIDQLTTNTVGQSHIISSGSFDLTTGLGTSTVESCTGPEHMCAGVALIIGTPDATSVYTALNVNEPNPDNITWDVIFTTTVPVNAVSNSTLTAIICTDADTDTYYAESGCGTEVDCDDTDDSINPGANEIPDDDIDQDCSGSDLIFPSACFISTLR